MIILSKAYLLPPTFLSGVMQPPTLLCPLALLCLHFTSPDNDPYPTANMSNGQGSSGLGSLITDHCYSLKVSSRSWLTGIIVLT